MRDCRVIESQNITELNYFRNFSNLSLKALFPIESFIRNKLFNDLNFDRIFLFLYVDVN